MVLALVAWLMTFGTASAGSPGDTGFLDRTVSVDGDTYRYQVYVPLDGARDAARPVLLFLHGSGERGEDGLLPTEVGIGTAIRRDRFRFPFVVVFPQCRPGARWYGAMERVALAALDASVAEFHGDPDRVSLGGISMGGAGAWYLAARHPERWAAVIPVCGRISLPAGETIPDEVRDLRGFDGSADSIAARLRSIPVWAFHGDADPVISVDETRSMVAALRRAGADVRYTEYPGVGHGSWDAAFAEPDLVPWMLSKRRAAPTGGAR